MRNHPLVLARSLSLGVGYDDAEDLVRSAARKGDLPSAAAVKEIDAARAAERARAARLNADMVKRLGLAAEVVARLIADLAADPAAETWLLRRVNLTRANGNGHAPAADEHPENQ